MPNLFGLDIAKLVADNIAAAGGVLDVTLTKTTPGTRTAGSLAAGTNPTTTGYACKGFIEDRTQSNRPGSLVQSGGKVVSIFGATLDTGVVPAPTDTVTIEGSTFTVLEVGRDPAAAVYELKVEV